MAQREVDELTPEELIRAFVKLSEKYSWLLAEHNRVIAELCGGSDGNSIDARQSRVGR